MFSSYTCETDIAVYFVVELVLSLRAVVLLPAAVAVHAERCAPWNMGLYRSYHSHYIPI